jgi:hypothetical protein
MSLLPGKSGLAFDQLNLGNKPLSERVWRSG